MAEMIEKKGYQKVSYFTIMLQVGEKYCKKGRKEIQYNKQLEYGVNLHFLKVAGSKDFYLYRSVYSR